MAPLPHDETSHIRWCPSPGLERLGSGALATVYKIDEHVVLKAIRLREPPTTDRSLRVQRFYASKTIFAFSLLKDERTVYRLLEQDPHPNIVEAIDIDHDEGIYLRKYLPSSEVRTPEQPGRILWYQDIIRGLTHLHNLHVAHNDVSKSNVVFTPQGRALLCDFSAATPFGRPSAAYAPPGFPVDFRTGPAKTLSDVTDRFAMASLIFRMEIGSKPEFPFGDNGTMILPELSTGHSGIDSMIRRAWLGQYSSTAEMLEDAESLHGDARRDTRDENLEQVPRHILRDRVRQWRKDREEQRGTFPYTRLAYKEYGHFLQG